MSLWVCTGCTCRYSVGAPRCPQCGDTEHWASEFEYEKGQTMAKITRHGGATDDVTGEGFSDDPNDDRAAGTRVAANTDEPAQVERFESVDDATAAQLEEGEQEHDGSDTALPPAENQDPDGEQMDAAPESPYAGWTKQNLQDEASRRGMSGAGTKAELVTRLDQDDQAGDPTQKA